MSEECVKSELDLFIIPLTQIAKEKNTYVEVPPISAISDSFSSQGMVMGQAQALLSSTAKYPIDRVYLKNFFLKTIPAGTCLQSG